jgi:uncharacterized lipoprotein YmbA
MTFSLSAARSTALLGSVLALGLLPGCNVAQPAQDDPTRYFVLSDPATSTVAVPAASAPRIGLHAIRLESYLKHREMVVRTAANEVQFKDYRRWAEPLDAAVGRVLRVSLVTSDSVSQVLSEPFPFDQQRDYDVMVDVRRCEGSYEGSAYKAEFSAFVEISTAGSDPKVVSRKLFTAPAADWDGTDYDRLASLLSADISALGQDIASSLPPKG